MTGTIERYRELCVYISCLKKTGKIAGFLNSRTIKIVLDARINIRIIIHTIDFKAKELEEFVLIAFIV